MPTFDQSRYKGLIYKIAIPSPLRGLFDYLPPETKQAIVNGMRVQVDFGHRKVIGFVISRAEESELSREKLKPILQIIDSEPIYSGKLLNLLEWCSQYYQHPIGDVFNAATPIKLRSARTIYQQETFYKLLSNNASPGPNGLARAPRQKALIGYLENKRNITKKEIISKGFSNTVINTLEKKGFIKSYIRDSKPQSEFAPIVRNSSKGPELNSEQQKAIDHIRAQGTGYNCFLLDGVTGSGKTEVYMQIMEDHLTEGRQCLILIPEIGLTPQTVSRFKNRFQCSIATLHSGINSNKRFEAWSQARSGASAIIIGTRSCVFTPAPNLGLIIVDEEHDGSFKQQEGFRYSARDIAVMRARKENIPVILGSATPSLESLYNARKKKFIYLSLSQRAGAASQAVASIIDTANEALDNGLSEQLLFKIEKHLSANNQTLLFINRRGYAPVLNCIQCGWVAECSACISQLTVHAEPPSMHCHLCGKTHHIPNICPQCKLNKLSTLGVGTQKLERVLNSKFSNYPVIRIDRDSARSERNFNAMLEQIQSGDPCILMFSWILGW